MCYHSLLMRTFSVAHPFSGLVVIAALLTANAGEKHALPEVGLPVSSPAPDFVLRNREGQPVRLDDFRGRKNVALVFYPAQFRAGS